VSLDLDYAVTSELRRLDDEDEAVWSRAEMVLYTKDGYDLLCRKTKCLFDMEVIENVPQTGNWGSDLEKYIAEHTPGMGLTDSRMHFTAEYERGLGVGGAVGGSTEGPTPATSPSEVGRFAAFGMPTKVATGRLSDGVVDVVRVTWDQLELFPEGSATVRRQDSQYEQREGGDPRMFTMDKDGLRTIRLVPPARGDADYATVDGSWGTMTQTTASVTVVGNYGILREVDGAFPAGGPHGTPTRQHPSTKNIVVEVARLGRSLDSHSFEIPDVYVKYVIFWAMHRALKRDGPGQDLKLAQHYASRFEMGVQRMQVRLKKVHKERILRMGFVSERQEPFGMGDPQPPYPFGPEGRKIQ
jgi:hypothetical protein